MKTKIKTLTAAHLVWNIREYRSQRWCEGLGRRTYILKLWLSWCVTFLLTCFLFWFAVHADVRDDVHTLTCTVTVHQCHQIKRQKYIKCSELPQSRFWNDLRAKIYGLTGLTTKSNFCLWNSGKFNGQLRANFSLLLKITDFLLQL